MSGRPSRPAKALRGAAVVFAPGFAFRIPTIEHQFTMMLAAAADVATQSSGAMLRLNPGQPSGIQADNPPLAILRRLISLHRRRGTADRLPQIVGLGDAAVAMPKHEALITLPPDTAALTLRETVSAPSSFDAGAIATAAYTRLAVGDRRGAVRAFDAALIGDDPRSSVWRAQRDMLTRHGSGSAYTIIRDSGTADLSGTPVLGAGQSGAILAYTLDPLEVRPLAIFARGSVAHGDGGRSALAAIGVQWHALAGLSIAAERQIGFGPAARGQWSIRVATGINEVRGLVRLNAYGEGGVIGQATYGAVQGRVAATLRQEHVEIEPGMGLWASVQDDHRTTVDRLDVGPSVTARVGPLAVELDYRVRAAGNASPGSGPVLTISAAF